MDQDPKIGSFYCIEFNNFNSASRNEDNILDQTYIKQIYSDFIMMI